MFHQRCLPTKTCRYGRVAGYVARVLFCCLGPALMLEAQESGTHYLHNGVLPPGAIGSQQLLRNGTLPGYFQPVEIKAPLGALVSLATAGQFGEAERAPVVAGMLIGAVYRLRVTHIPRTEGLEVFPTVEVIDRTYPPPGVERRFPIAVELMQDDLQLALEGKFVTRVIYLEDPQSAVPVRSDVAGQTWFDVAPGRDPLAVADALGRPVAILRLGGKLPSDGSCPDPNFFFGSPPFVRYGAPTQSPPPAASRPAATRPGAKSERFVVRGQNPGFEVSPPAMTTGAVPSAPPSQGIVLPTPATAPAPGQPLLYPAPPAYGAMHVPAPTPPLPAFGGPCPPGPAYGAPGMEQGVPLPTAVTGPWAPPRLGPPPPPGEYLCDGGAAQRVRVGRNGEIRGLELEDTVVHFNTPDGRTLVQPSNRACVYSPRFASVRQVVGVVADEQIARAGGVHRPLRVSVPAAVQPVASSKQHVQAINELEARPAGILRTKEGGDVVSSAIGPRGFQDAFKPYENITVLRTGVFEAAEIAFLARGSTAALAWTNNLAAQVILDRKAAMEDVGQRKLQTVYTIDAPPPQPRLRVIKVASTQYAQPGEDVDFTIRFDNIGNQTINHVTILDNLTTRLEYVPDSAQCSLAANFTTRVNEGDSLLLRCELKDPLPVGHGGVLRFQCRVR